VTRAAMLSMMVETMIRVPRMRALPRADGRVNAGVLAPVLHDAIVMLGGMADQRF
jgi:hypothetical protein